MHSTNIHSQARIFPINQVNERNIRDKEFYTANFARTEKYRKSVIPSIQRMLNHHVAGVVGAAGDGG